MNIVNIRVAHTPHPNDKSNENQNEDRRSANFAIAKEAIDYCRKFIPINRSSTHHTLTDKNILLSLFPQLKEARTRSLQIGEALLHILMYEDNYLKSFKKITKSSKKYHIGNCGELSSLAINFLRKKDIQRAEEIYIENSDHAFVIIDREGDNLKDPSTWGPGCVVLDILNNNVFEPAEIYEKLKCYRFDMDQDNPHILTEFTQENNIKVSGEIRRYKDSKKNAIRIENFIEKLDYLNNFSKKYLSTREFKEFSVLVESIKTEVKDKDDLTNFELERFLDKRMKKIIKHIEQKIEEPDNLLNSILTNYLFMVDDNTALHQAITFDQGNVVRRLLDIGADPYSKLSNGSLPFHVAAEKGHVAMMEDLLIFDKNLSMVDNQNSLGETPLHIAAKKGWIDVIKLLLQRNANITRTDNNEQIPLHVAASKQEVEILYLLLNANPSTINYKNNLGWTALHLAIENQNHRTIKTLLEFGANSQISNNDGVSPLHLAIVAGKLKSLEILLYYDKECINHQDKEGRTALHHAVQNNAIVALKLLLAHGADNKITAADGSSPLHLAAQLGNYNCIKYIIDNDDGSINYKDQTGMTCLHYAAKAGDYESVELLLEHNADVNLGNNSALLPLHSAARFGHANVLKLLLKHDIKRASLNHQNSDGFTALHLAVINGRIEIIKLLLEEGADINIKNKDGLSSLELVKLLDDQPMLEVFNHHIKNQDNNNNLANQF